MIKPEIIKYHPIKKRKIQSIYLIIILGVI